MRYRTPDILKGLAIILMIQVHLIELFATKEVMFSAFGEISLFLGGIPAAPVFMAVMGYFLARSTKKMSYNIYRGLKLIIYGFLLNIGLNLHLLIRIFTGEIPLNPWEYIFGADILIMAGMSIIIIVLLKKVFCNGFHFYFILAMLITFVHKYIPNIATEYAFLKYIQAFFWGYYHWSYFPLMPWLAYSLLGVSFRLFEKQYLDQVEFWKWKYLVYFVALVLIISSFRFGFSISTNLQAYYHHHLLYFLWATSFLIVWAGIFKELTRFIGNALVFKYFRWLGKNVTSVYIIQWLIIGNIAVSIYKTQKGLQLLYWFPVILIATSAIVYGINYLKEQNSKGKI